MSETGTQGFRWIMYTYDPLGGFDVVRIRSLGEAKSVLVQYGKDTGFHQDLTVNGDYGPTGSLYPYSEEDWDSAVEFKDTGNPFDYPSYVVESGPRGGVRITRA